jgi:hypothetical protein
LFKRRTLGLATFDVLNNQLRAKVAVVRVDAEAGPRLAFTLYEAVTDQTPGDLVFNFIGCGARSLTRDPANQNIIRRVQ